MTSASAETSTLSPVRTTISTGTAATGTTTSTSKGTEKERFYKKLCSFGGDDPSQINEIKKFLLKCLPKNKELVKKLWVTGLMTSPGFITELLYGDTDVKKKLAEWLQNNLIIDYAEYDFDYRSNGYEENDVDTYTSFDNEKTFLPLQDFLMISELKDIKKLLSDKRQLERELEGSKIMLKSLTSKFKKSRAKSSKKSLKKSKKSKKRKQ
jgi:hypothetical protein